MSHEVAAVRKYLGAEFPGSSVESIENAITSRRGSVLFHVVDVGSRHKLEVSKSFLECRTPEQIGDELAKRGTGSVLRSNSDRRVFLGEGGFLIDR